MRSFWLTETLPSSLAAGDVAMGAQTAATRDAGCALAAETCWENARARELSQSAGLAPLPRESGYLGNRVPSAGMASVNGRILAVQSRNNSMPAREVPISKLYRDLYRGLPGLAPEDTHRLLEGGAIEDWMW